MSIYEKLVCLNEKKFKVESLSAQVESSLKSSKKRQKKVYSGKLVSSVGKFISCGKLVNSGGKNVVVESLLIEKNFFVKVENLFIVKMA